MENMSKNTKLEIAVEILAVKIAMTTKLGKTEEDEEIKNLMKERDEMYTGNEKIIDKIIKIYGPEIKKNYENS